jgi:hypothetical protein
LAAGRGFNFMENAALIFNLIVALFQIAHLWRLIASHPLCTTPPRRHHCRLGHCYYRFLATRGRHCPCFFRVAAEDKHELVNLLLVGERRTHVLALRDWPGPLVLVDE